MTHFNILKQEESLSSRLISRRFIPLRLSVAEATKDRVMHYPSGFPAFALETRGGERKRYRSPISRRRARRTRGGVTRTTSEVPQVAAECDD